MELILWFDLIKSQNYHWIPFTLKKSGLRFDNSFFSQHMVFINKLLNSLSPCLFYKNGLTFIWLAKIKANFCSSIMESYWFVGAVPCWLLFCKHFFTKFDRFKEKIELLGNVAFGFSYNFDLVEKLRLRLKKTKLEEFSM